nr:hypothetical protein [Tanacetum cinerariifolium]
MALCTNLQNRVLDLEQIKATQKKKIAGQHDEIVSLKRRVKKLEKKNRSRTHRLKRLYKVGLSTWVESSGDEESLGEDTSKQGRKINAIDADEDITLVSAADNKMFDVDVLDPHYFNVESDIIESLSNRDTLFDSSPKFYYLEEFSGELMLTSIIDEEIDIFTSTDDLMPLGIESDDYDSEGDIQFFEELLSNDTPPIPENDILESMKTLAKGFCTQVFIFSS